MDLDYMKIDFNKLSDKFRIRRSEQEISDGNFENLYYYLNNGPEHSVEHCLEWICYYGKLELLKNLTNYKINDSVDKIPAMQSASERGHIDIIEFMFNNNIVSKPVHSYVLIEAIENKHTNIINYLLENKCCDLNSMSSFILSELVKNYDLSMVKMFVEKYNFNICTISKDELEYIIKISTDMDKIDLANYLSSIIMNTI